MNVDEFLAERADRINKILDRADQMGDGAASLGTLIMVFATDSEWDSFTDPEAPSEVVQSVLDSIEARFVKAGVKTE
jgi:hypothetical protein